MPSVWHAHGNAIELRKRATAKNSRREATAAVLRVTHFSLWGAIGLMHAVVHQLNMTSPDSSRYGGRHGPTMYSDAHQSQPVTLEPHDATCISSMLNGNVARGSALAYVAAGPHSHTCRQCQITTLSYTLCCSGRPIVHAEFPMQCLRETFANSTAYGAAELHPCLRCLAPSATLLSQLPTC